MSQQATRRITHQPKSSLVMGIWDTGERIRIDSSLDSHVCARTTPPSTHSHSVQLTQRPLFDLSHNIQESNAEGTASSSVMMGREGITGPSCWRMACGVGRSLGFLFSMPCKHSRVGFKRLQATEPMNKVLRLHVNGYCACT